MEETHIVLRDDHAMRIVVEDPALKGPRLLAAMAADDRPLAHFRAVEAVGSEPGEVPPVETDEFGDHRIALHPKTAVDMEA